MVRVSVAGSLVMLFLTAVSAQTPDSGAVKVTLTPTAPPARALKYRLLPELRDQKPGNAVVLYYRAFSPELYFYNRDRELSERISMWLSMPIKELKEVPRDQLSFLDSKQLQEVDRAARREYCDWDLTARVVEEGASLLLPDLQAFRQIASALALRARVAFADGDFAKAVYSLQTGLVLARHVSEGPTLIHALVGMAIASIMLEQVEELIQTPGAPNLYWALTDLPRPFVDLRKATQGERLFCDNLFPGLRELAADAKAGPLSGEQLRSFVDNVIAAYRMIDGVKAPEWELRLGLATLAAQVYPEAKKALIAQGRPAELVDAMPVVQVAMLHAINEYDRLFDDMMKWSNLPYWEARVGLQRAVEELKKTRAKEGAGGGGLPLATLLLPAMEKVVTARARVDRKLAALRCLEAIRLHAASHKGELPAELSDIKEVPLPADPLTGKPFEYKIQNGKAILQGTAPDGEPAGLNSPVKYEVSLRK